MCHRSANLAITPLARTVPSNADAFPLVQCGTRCFAPALLLAPIGTYGVLAYMVAERRREVGIRLALGATPGRVLGQVMSQGQALTGAGVVVGLLAALGLTRLLTTLLFDVQPADPMTLAVVIPLVVVISAAACWFPAWRASRLDPNMVLRVE